jgi:hypothetical protein
MHKHFNKFLQSVVVFPALTMTLALNPVAGITAKIPTAAAISSEQTRNLSSALAVNQQQNIDDQVVFYGAKVDAFMAKYKLPMLGYGEEMVRASLENGLTHYEVAVVATIESTAGKFACPNDKFNAFGWGSCHGQKFSSYEEAIHTVARTLGGNNPGTNRYYVKENGELKDFNTRFEIYNGYANEKYIDNIEWAMEKFDSMQVQPVVKLASL